MAQDQSKAVPKIPPWGQGWAAVCAVGKAMQQCVQWARLCCSVYSGQGNTAVFTVSKAMLQCEQWARMCCSVYSGQHMQCSGGSQSTVASGQTGPRAMTSSQGLQAPAGVLGSCSSGFPGQGLQVSPRPRIAGVTGQGWQSCLSFSKITGVPD